VAIVSVNGLDVARMDGRLRRRSEAAVVLAGKPAASHPEDHCNDEHRNDDQQYPPDHELPPGRLPDFIGLSMRLASVIRDPSGG
jgi:hypothetical protein